jgi:subtilase family serine protease
MAAANFRLTYYMSPDDSTPGAGTAIGFRDFAGLAPGVNASSVTTLTVPLGLNAGAHFLSAVVDSGNAVTELVESNNGLTAPTPVVLALARSELSILALTAPASGQLGRPLAIGATVTNRGQLAASSFRLTFFMSPMSSAGPGTPVGSRAYTGLAAGLNSSTLTTITIPVAFAPDTYRLSALVDSDHGVTELDETNNAFTADTTVTVTPYQPDLVVTALSGPPSGLAIVGRPLSVTSSVRNVGPSPTTSFRVAFFLSTDGQLDVADIPLGTRTISTLASGGTSTATSNLVIPAPTPPFDYRLIAKIDDQQIVPELLETNNIAATTTTIAVLPSMTGTFPLTLILILSNCTDPDFNNGEILQPVTLRGTTQTGRAFTGTASGTEIDPGITVVTTFGLSGSLDTFGEFTGSFTFRATGNGVLGLSGNGPVSGSIFGNRLAGTFTGLLNIFDTDVCQIAGTFASP